MDQLWEVICQDGKQRHLRPFKTRALACDWAEFGHACTVYHVIQPLPNGHVLPPKED